MAKKNIDASTIRRISAELDCDPLTVKKVFKTKKATKFPISRRVYAALVRDGFIDDKAAA
jgi:hypothetical protein